MSIADAIILGVIQGLTEFLPISSSGHLALAQILRGGSDPEQAVVVSLLVHLASLTAVVVHYRKRLLELVTSRRDILQLVVATLPVVLVGAVLNKYIKPLHAMPMVICAMLVVNGAFLYISDRWGRGHRPIADASWWHVLTIGIAQAILIPGLSRSGRTIGTGWLLRFERSEAVRFSFLMSIPAVLGAVVWESRKLLKGEVSLPLRPALVAVAVTFVLSLVSIRIVERLAVGRKWLIFIAYSVIAGVAGLLYFGLR